MSLTHHLTALETSGLIRLAQAEPELEYLFRHALVQDAVYESILKADRRILHRAIGETLERLYPDRLSELASMLAHHFREASEAGRAFKYFALAGDAALAIYANAEAEAHYRAALNLASAEADKTRALSGLGEALYTLSRFEDALQIWREAITRYQSLKDDDGVARLYARSASAAWAAGDPPRQLALARAGLASVPDGLATSGMARLLLAAAMACYFNVLRDEGRLFCQKALQLAERLNDVDAQARALTTLAVFFRAAGEPDQAMTAFTRAITLAESAGLLSVAMTTHNNLGDFLVNEVGDLQAGLEHVLRALSTSRRMGIVANEFFYLRHATNIELQLGDLASASANLPILRQLARALPNPDSHLLGAVEAEFWRYAGEEQQAVCRLRECQADLRQRGNQFRLYSVNLDLAETLFEMGEWEEAGRTLSEAMPIGDEMEGKVTSRCLLSAVRAHEGRIEDARRLLAEAQAAFPQPGPVDMAALSRAKARLATAEKEWSEAFAAFEVTAGAEARMGKRWYRAQTLREWAEAHLARGEAGDRERAIELLREALGLFETMNAPKYAERVRGRLKEL